MKRALAHQAPERILREHKETKMNFLVANSFQVELIKQNKCAVSFHL
jgi:hypothetical protein